MKLFIFNNQEQLIKVIEPLEAVSEEEINKIHKIEATLRYSDVFDSNNDISESATYVGHKDYDNGDIFHFYKIDHITKTSLTEVKLVGVNSFYDDMQSDGYIKDFRPTNKSVMSILQTLLEGSRWQLGIVKSTELVTLNFYYLSRKEAISKLLEVANIEIRPRVELSKNAIIRRYLDVFTTLGADHGKVFTHGKDLLTVSEKASQGAIYTAAIGRGKGEEITDSNGQATGGYGRRITFKDIVWRRNSGNPVDKPKGQEFVEIPELTAKYGFANGTKPRLKIIEFQDEEDPEKLLRLTYAWLEKNSRVQVEYKATVNNVGNCNLGDTVGIYNPTIGIKYKTRVFSVKRNLIDNNLTEFGIGDKVTTSPFSRTTEVAKNLKNLEDNTIYWLDQLRDKIKDNFLNEDGYNYDLGVNNKYHLPAGLYSFDKPIDQEPAKVVYVGAGKVAIANSKLPDGKWDWKTFLDGNGATLDLVNTGTLRAGIIQSSDGTSYWNLDTGEFKITQKAIEDVTYKAIEKQLKEKKDELKGDSSYIHKKYSNNANGTPMTDDTNSKYMGIYTGTSKIPPVNASDYNWIKIKFEERLVKGYANSKTGLDFTTVEPFEESTLVAKNRPRVRITNNNDISDIWQANDEVFLKPDRYYYISIRAKGNANGLHIYIKDYNNNSLIWENLTFGNELQIKSTTFVTPKNMSDNNVWLKFAMQPEDANWEGVEVDWWTIQEYGGHDNFRDFPLNTPAQYHKFRYFGYANITDGKPTADKFEWFDLQQKSMQTDKYTHLVYSDNPDGTDFGKAPKKYMGIARTTSPVTPTNKEDFKWFKITGEDGKKGEDGHSLNAYLRLEGSYLNGNIANFGAYVKAMYDGVQISNFDISHSYRGASFQENSNQASTVDSNGLITNLGLNANKTDGTPLYVDITVKYKGLTSVASARLDNTVDVELVNNTIKKFKTFESTLENFESTIKEIDNKKFKMAYNIENLCSETELEKKGNDLYFNTKRPLEANKYYYILAYLKNVPDGRLARIYYAENNGDNKSITNGLNIWRVKYNSPQTRVNIFSQGSDTTVKNVEIYEVPEVPFPSEDVLASFENNDISYFNLRFKRKIKPNEILKLTFNVKGRPTMDYSYYCENAVLSVRPLVEGENICIFRVKEETDLIQFSYRGNGISGQKSDFKCVKIVFDKGYKNEYNISDMESSIKQTKSTIDLSVKKNEVINSINLSGEGVKINADKVDISGTLSAYTGLIGGFRIGNNPNDGGYWLTGMNNFDCGINPGHNVGTRGIQLWAAWGNNWTNPSDRAWWVNAQGEMHCKGTSYFTGNSNFESTTFNQTPQMKKGLYVNGNIQVTGNIYYNNGGENSGYWIYSTYYKSIAPNSARTYVYLTYSGGGSDWIPLNKEISDRRFKRNIQPSAVNGLEIINSLKTYSYTKEYDGKTEDIECGIMAQDVKKHAKSAFQEAPEEVQTYSTFKLVPYLIKAVQELSEKVENLEKQLKERSKKDGI